MRLVLQVAIVVAVSLLCGACGGRVSGTVTTFYDPSALSSDKTIAILPSDKGLQNSLEFKTYAARIGDHLQKKGYTVISPYSTVAPDQIAFLSYGMNNWGAARIDETFG